MSLDRALLNECQRAAEESSCYAETALSIVQKKIASDAGDIEKIFNTLSNQKKQDNVLITQLKKEKTFLHDFAERTINEIYKSIKNRKAEMQYFTITLFGKTMAGKSTLMEILRHGDGSSIGKGKQRTTLDVREYEWNSLRIIDVPGFGAANEGGRLDENVAYEAAKKGDMIIFLLTDDRPDREEADWMEKIRNLGKPVLGILNVKNGESDISLLQYDLEERFASEDLKSIIRQFYEFGVARKQSWENVYFIPTHLKSAFDAQQETDKNRADIYKKLSHFSDVTDNITKVLKEKGKLLRFKTFIDLVDNPADSLYEEIDTYQRNLSERKNDVNSSQKKFQDLSKSLLQNLKKNNEKIVESIRDDLKVFLDGFAESHYYLQGNQIEISLKLKIEERQKKYNLIIQRHIDNTIGKLKVLLSEVYSDFIKRYNGHINSNMTEFKLNFDGGKISDYTIWLDLVSMTIGHFNPIAGIFTEIISHFIPSKEKRENKARKSLRNELSKIEEDFVKHYNNTLLEISLKLVNEIKSINAEFNQMSKFIENLDSIHCNSLTKLDNVMNELNKQIVYQVVNKKSISVKKIERTLGKSFTIHLNAPRMIDEQSRKKLEDVLQEKVRVVSR